MGLMHVAAHCVFRLKARQQCCRPNAPSTGNGDQTVGTGGFTSLQVGQKPYQGDGT
jgi:hypothetical protein